jgi:hypothetical protein
LLLSVTEVIGLSQFSMTRDKKAPIKWQEMIE